MVTGEGLSCPGYIFLQQSKPVSVSIVVLMVQGAAAFFNKLPSMCQDIQ